MADYEITPFKRKDVVVKGTCMSRVDWTPPTVVLRLLSIPSQEYCAYVAGPEAIQSIARLEVGRVIELSVPPRCVSTTDGPMKYYGMADAKSIRYKYPIT